MYAPKRLAAGLVAAAALATAGPLVANAAAAPSFLPTDSNGQVCLHGVSDPGPLGPMGPYGQYGPYGADGPLHGQANPLGDVASCGGSLAYALRGGSVSSFVQANLQAANQH